jgi:hypothetical protein
MDDDGERLRAELADLRTQRDAALAEVRHLSRVNEREWADYLAMFHRMTRAEAKVRAVEDLCAEPVGYVVVLSLRAALAGEDRLSRRDPGLRQAG